QLMTAPDSPRTPRPPETVDLAPGAGGAAPPGGESPQVARAFGDYELIGEIERGGQGVVYLARERTSGRLVALKMMLDQSASSQADLSRFVLEAQAAAELQHPGVVAIHAWGVHDGHPFYTMDFVPGRPLHKVLADGPLPPERAVGYLVGVARALAAAHALGIVHRDLKPSNVMIDSADQPRVLDFGLAKRHRNLAPPPRGGRSDAGDDDILEAIPVFESPAQARSTPRVSAPLTEKGAILGTPSYMAPEQVRAEHQHVGPAADVHALGAIFYEMLTGRPPFLGDSTYATLMQVLGHEPARVRSLRPQVPATLDAVCRRCLAKDPRQRYPDAAALADDLERRWRQATQGTRFARLALVAAVALVVLQCFEPLLVGRPSAEPGTLEGIVLALRPQAGPLHDAAGVLDRLLRGLVVVGGPLLGGLGLAVWSAAWCWYAERRVLLAIGWAAAALAALYAWLFATGIPSPASAFLPWVLVVNALGVAVVAALRRPPPVEALTPPPAEGESYLQKLLAVGPAPRPRKAVAGAAAVEMADFDLGKRLHVWEGGALHRARQKSLDRVVLVWRDSNVSADGTVPGVVVRHPAVLGLHAVCAAPDERLLVTEMATANPLSEVLSQRSLTLREALQLAGRVAEALQAFHDQGACHGRLSADWVLVNGELEPALCPCGVPSQSADDRAADLRALGALLEGWLPRRSLLWRSSPLAAAYRACDGAREGAYRRAADFAADLARADHSARVRWRERWVGALLLALLLLPWGIHLLRRLVTAGEESAPGGGAPALLPLALAFLCPTAILAGYAQARSLVQYLRLRRPGRDRILPGLVALRLGQAGAFAALALALGVVAIIDAGTLSGAALPALLLVLGGYWAVGGGLAGIVTFGELLARSLRRAPAAARGAAP
ncbi:MAG TPA: protein kinase, partial [Gemmataceae bacterium]|nr:protein kinase [Gemmataceae bacterium]